MDDILAWATNELRPWQSDAVRRLFQKVELDATDYAELGLLLRASRGLTGDVAPAAVPLTAAHLPSTGVGEVVLLEALHSLKNVNRLVAGQQLRFNATGVTVIYGDNGSGKSGYSRVIKSACRARVKDEKVLPDARHHTLLHETPEAVFTVKQGGSTLDVKWLDGQSAPKELASVAVLDTRCARAYTDQEGELIFAPWGLDVVENLARVVFPKLEEGIKAEQTALPVSDAAFADLKTGKTQVAKFLGAVTHKTTSAQVKAETTLDEQAEARLKVIDVALAAKSPAEQAKALREQSTRLNSLVTSIEALARPLEIDEIGRLAGIDRDLAVAVQAEVAAAANLRGDFKLLAGTGEGAWRNMFAAAQQFLTAHEHVVVEGKPCPLCQTALSEGAADRLARFAAFVADDASSRATAQRARHRAVFDALSHVKIEPTLDATTIDYLRATEETWPALVERYTNQLRTRRDWLLKAAETHDWATPPAVDVSPVTLPRKLATDLEERAKALDAAQDAAKRVELQQELAELNARKALVGRKEALLEWIAALHKHNQLTACLADLKTRPISEKAGALAGAAVTKQLSTALNDEFGKLGVSHLQASLSTRSDKGRTKLKLVLDLPGFQKPELVLSEGEQRVIAIASFFAELGVSHHRGAAVFDDPVSSLDHKRRQHVARRLVAECAQRQVVVFTHDTVFLAELTTELERTSSPFAVHHLTYSQQHVGVVNEGLPWSLRKTSDRFDKIEKLAKKFEEAETSMDNDQLEETSRRLYGRLREIIERGVEEVVFCGVLQRYNDYVRVPNIAKTVGLTSAECQPIVALYERAGDVLGGHDKAGARAFAAPTAADVKRDIATLRKALDDIRERQKVASKALGAP
ncbi:AAA family ATPase [Rhizobacter sp. P5_C2]